MDFKEKINSKGLKVSWIATQLGINYNSLRVYLHDQNKMPIEVEDMLKNFLQ